jgi:hypothetical protein
MHTITPGTRAVLGALLGGIGLAAGCASKPGAFRTPDEAGAALVAALQPYNADRVVRVLGGGAPEVVESGDPVADQNNFDTFARAYAERHHFESGPDDTTTICVGENDWPLPIPLVRDGSEYRFDLERGKDEVLSRRIGRNELDTIQTCRAIVDAQRDYFDLMQSGSEGGSYAAKFLSTPGMHDGLYWPTSEGEAESPLGALVAEATAQGYTAEGRNEGPKPFHGYYFRMLSAQGANAPGGARSYLVEGRLKDGFAVVAYPVEYGNSGIMTFLVNQNGVVYERDLGEETGKTAAAITVFDPDDDWTIVPP